MFPLENVTSHWPYLVVAQQAGSNDNPRPLRFLECNHVPLGHRATCIDVDSNANLRQSAIEFANLDDIYRDPRVPRPGEPVIFGGPKYLIRFLGSLIRHVNITDRESQLYKDDGNDGSGNYLECLPYNKGDHFILWIPRQDSYVGIEKFESGWYLTVSPLENAARFYVIGQQV
ncbi:hypothetical protein MVEG_12388 [Podila verticillata NRRL 6337]|uniref:Uncharacterized protein n=1 Tax=Podila verticillata NRRL 6337 TaxID=1069443 RepID=A0A086TIJ5_9FUNG|nr:hypothetical protein MVEG_12388 [Podila verticillata NRRL 6337]